MGDLREFIKKSEEIDELRVIEGANWDWEIGAITYSVAKGPNPPAVLFDKVGGYKAGYRVLVLHCATDRRMALLWEKPAEITGLDLVRATRDKMSEPFEPLPPVEVKDGPVVENVQTGKEVDLFKFPTPQWRPEQGGRYIGLGDSVIVKDPDEGWVNVGAYRVQIHDKTTATIMIEPGRQADIIRKKYWAKGQSCPVAVSCGGDPLLHVFAGIRMPWGISEYDYVGWWRNEPVPVVKGPTTGLPIPAYEEIVLEGEMVPPEVETRIEGPFAEYPGHYSPARPEPAFRVKAVLHRNDPIIFGVLPYLGPGLPYKAENIWVPAQVWSKLDELVPGVKGVWHPMEFGGLRCLVISLEQKYAGHAKQAAMAALAIRGYMQRYVIVVDDDIDPTNLREVLFAVSYRAEPEEFDIIKGWYGSPLDPRLSPEKRAVEDFTLSAAVILACKPYHWIKDFPPLVKPSAELEKKVRGKWGKLAL